MPPDAPTPGTGGDWLERAKSALAIARQPMPEVVFWEDLCYQAQQAAEKAIKAVFIHKRLIFAYTHDIEELGAELEEKGVVVPAHIKEAISLSRYATETRYPGYFEPVTEDEFRQAVALAERAIEWAERVLKEPA